MDRQLLGCSKCRYSASGCAQCRKPGFKPRSQAPIEELRSSAAASRQRRVVRRKNLPPQGPQLTSHPPNLIGQLRKHLEEPEAAQGGAARPHKYRRVAQDGGPSGSAAPPVVTTAQQHQEQQGKRSRAVVSSPEDHAQVMRPGKFRRIDPQALEAYGTGGVDGSVGAPAPSRCTSDSGDAMDLDIEEDTIAQDQQQEQQPFVPLYSVETVGAATGGGEPSSQKRDFLTMLEDSMQKRRERRLSGAELPDIESIRNLPRRQPKRRKRDGPASPTAAPLHCDGQTAGDTASDPRAVLWDPPVSPYGLIEEELYHDPWKLLVACMLLNKTTGAQVRKVIWDLFKICPTPEAAIQADVAVIEALIQPLGLFRKRAVAIQRLSEDYLHKQWQAPTELYGIGKYAADAYFMFCRGQWRDLQPEDKELKAYHAWLRETDGLGRGLARSMGSFGVQEGMGHAFLDFMNNSNQLDMELALGNVPRPSDPLAAKMEVGLHNNSIDFQELDMAKKLEEYKTQLKEPYWKRAPKVVTATDLAKVKRKAAAMGKDFQALWQAHERQDKAVTDLRQKVRQLRQDVEAKDKQLSLAYRTVERLAIDKNALEASSAQDKAHIRKLEARLTTARNIDELGNQFTEQQTELESLRLQLISAEEQAAAAEERFQQQKMDLAFMKRGIELAAEQLTKSSGADVSSTMLLAVAQGQEEATGLLAQLNKLREHNNQLTQALEAAKEHLQAQHNALYQWQEADSVLREQVQALETALEKECATTAHLKKEMETLRPTSGRDEAQKALELERTKRFELEHMVERVMVVARAKDAEVAALKSEVQRLKIEVTKARLSGPTAHALSPQTGRRATKPGPQSPVPAFSPQMVGGRGRVRIGGGVAPAAPRGVPSSVGRQAPAGMHRPLPSTTPQRQQQHQQQRQVQVESQRRMVSPIARLQPNMSSLDDHIAFLEGELADLTSAAAVRQLQDNLKATVVTGRRGSPAKHHHQQGDGGMDQNNKRSRPMEVPQGHRDNDDVMEYSPVRGKSLFESPQKYEVGQEENQYQPAPPVWRDNPLASSPPTEGAQFPDTYGNFRESTPELHLSPVPCPPPTPPSASKDMEAAMHPQGLPPHQLRHSVPQNQNLNFNTVNEEMGWELLQQHLDQQKALEHRMNAVWQPHAVPAVEGSVDPAGSISAAAPSDTAAPSSGAQSLEDPRGALGGSATVQSNSATSCTARPAEMRGHGQGQGAQSRPRPPPPRIDVNVPRAPEAQRSPALSALQSLRGSGADWLNAGFEPDIEQLEVKSAMKGARRQQEGQRQTLFDLANMEIEI